MKYITSTELQTWGKTEESQDKLPLLLRRLIINNIGFEHFEIFRVIHRGLENENNQNNLWNKNVYQCKKLLHKISGNDPIYERTVLFEF